jgi:hypothetical protein
MLRENPERNMEGHWDWLWMAIFSAIGFGYFLYGKKQQHLSALACGLALMIYPYFFASAWAIFLIGLVLSAIPWLLR